MKRGRLLMCFIMAMAMVFAMAAPISVDAAVDGTEVTVETVDQLKQAIENEPLWINIRSGKAICIRKRHQ